MTDRLVNTKTAALTIGLSEYELRLGAKSGRYPCLSLTGGKRLRWRLDLLQDAIEAEMKKDSIHNEEENQSRLVS